MSSALRPQSSTTTTGTSIGKSVSSRLGMSRLPQAQVITEHSLLPKTSGDCFPHFHKTGVFSPAYRDRTAKSSTQLPVASLGLEAAGICRDIYHAQYATATGNDYVTCSNDLAGAKYHFNCSSQRTLYDLLDFLLPPSTSMSTTIMSSTKTSSIISSRKSSSRSSVESTSSTKSSSKSSSESSSKMKINFIIDLDIYPQADYYHYFEDYQTCLQFNNQFVRQEFFQIFYQVCLRIYQEKA
ncbi:hypothetical protein N431DRAFT_458846 [Stipitochalara longipes BDJ]|nr:hypothetical protein N431DRAFT_458846 [Stipitochalara longipes BDJ]